MTYLRLSYRVPGALNKSDVPVEMVVLIGGWVCVWVRLGDRSINTADTPCKH